MNQLTLFEFAAKGMKAQAEIDKLCHNKETEKSPKFDGRTFEEKLDSPRLTKQLERVREYMLAIFPTWKTLEEISEALEKIYRTKFLTQSISARLRDLRKKEFGRYDVPKKRREGQENNGVWEYLVRS